MILEGDGGSAVMLRRCDVIAWRTYPVPVWVGSALSSRGRPSPADVAECLEWLGARTVCGRVVVDRLPPVGARGVRVWRKPTG